LDIFGIEAMRKDSLNIAIDRLIEDVSIKFRATITVSYGYVREHPVETGSTPRFDVALRLDSLQRVTGKHLNRDPDRLMMSLVSSI
jgi:hypothetical protein